MWDWSVWGWWGGMSIMMIIMVVFWGGIIALIVWGITRLVRSGTPSSSQRTPLDIARERYAKGEITKEQFEALKKDLV